MSVIPVGKHGMVHSKSLISEKEEFHIEGMRWQTERNGLVNVAGLLGWPCNVRYTNHRIAHGDKGVI